MELTQTHKAYIDKCVLCWLATASQTGEPNVSPKEIFTHFGPDAIIIANIASPQTVRNIRNNPQACASFIDILIQKGFQMKGKAEIIGKDHPDFAKMHEALSGLASDQFPFGTVTRLTVEKIKPIVAPRYVLYPDTTEEAQVERARKTYGL